MQDVAGREQGAKFGQPLRSTAVFRRCRPHTAEIDWVESPWFNGQRALEAQPMPPAGKTVRVDVILLEKAFLGEKVEVGQARRIDIVLTARRIDSVGFPANEETRRAGARPTERYLKAMMKFAECDAAENLNAAPHVGAGVAEHDAKLINFTARGYIANRPEQRSRSAV
jgi:hypothetical protein